MDFSNYAFRCSSLHLLAAEPKDKAAKEAGELSATAKTELVKEYLYAVYGIDDEESNKYFEKGNLTEEDGITMLSRRLGFPVFKNKERRNNGWITGELDVVTDIVYDNKSSWDAQSHFKKMMEQTPKRYYWQMQGYMWLWEKEGAKLCHTLINTPAHMVDAEVRRARFNNPELTEEQEQDIRDRHNFDHIPMGHRVWFRPIMRAQSQIEAIPAMVEKGRKFLQDLHNMQNL